MVPFSKLKMGTDALNTNFNGNFWMESRETNMLGHLLSKYIINIRLNGMLGTCNCTHTKKAPIFFFSLFLFLPHIEPFLMATRSLGCLNKEPVFFFLTIIILLVILVTKLITHLQEGLRELSNCCSLSTPSCYFQHPWAELECNGFTKQH